LIFVKRFQKGKPLEFSKPRRPTCLFFSPARFPSYAAH
jgi:hypothetical protein